MVVITLRIPAELKEKMRKRSDINWSEVARKAIGKRIEIEDRLEAIRQIDEAKLRVEPVKKGHLDKWIRRDRAI